MSAGNKITKNLNVAEGSNRQPGKMYGRSWTTYQAEGGYKGYPNHRHRDQPSDKALENSYARSVGQWAVSVKMPASAKIDVQAGSQNRGRLEGTHVNRSYAPKKQW